MPEFLAEAPQATASKGLAQGPYVAARAKFEPMTIRLKYSIDYIFITIKYLLVVNFGGIFTIVTWSVRPPTSFSELHFLF